MSAGDWGCINNRESSCCDGKMYLSELNEYESESVACVVGCLFVQATEQGKTRAIQGRQAFVERSNK